MGEREEWLGELTVSWTEVYKKSMTTVVLLRLVAERGPIGVLELAEALTERTGWSFTERGLYRTTRRLVDHGVLTYTEVTVPRTGARRKDLTLTGLGREYLGRIEAQLIA